MDSMEDKIGSILGNPEMMQKIMAMAQALNTNPPQPDSPKPQPEFQQPKAPPKSQSSAGSFPDIDVGMLQKFSGLARQSSIDKEQQNLLRALNPYLSRERIRKLENAMRAAKMAKLAAAALGSQGGINPSAR